MITMDILKTCIKCSTAKPLSEYYRHPQMNDGHLGQCKECHKAAMAERYDRVKDTPEEKAKRATRARTARLQRYGLTAREYGALMEEQDGKCAICGSAEAGAWGGSLPVDHDHETGKVRGLLCHGCNVGLGYFHDDPDSLLAAAAYLLSRKGEVF